jgi:hypothetical protein
MLESAVLGTLFLTGLTVAAPARAQCPAWTDGFEPAGLDGPVRALLGSDEGGTRVLYAGGDFGHAGGTVLAHVAKRENGTWIPLGAGTDGTVLALLEHDDGTGRAIYAAGAFTQAGGVAAANVARWDGSSWSPLGTGLDATVTALAEFDDGTGPKLYAAGEFLNAGGAPAAHVARWDGASWSALGAGTDTTVNALASFNGRLYAGGDFLQAGGVAASRVAAWDGSTWTALGEGTNQPVLALAACDPGTGAKLFVGGAFTQAGGTTANFVAAWNGTAWSTLSNGVLGLVWSLAEHREGALSRLIVGGDFTSGSSVTLNRTGVWNGSSWSELGIGVNGSVRALADGPDETGPGGLARSVFAGGLMGVPADAHVTRFDATTFPFGQWVPIGPILAVDAPVLDLVVHDDGGGPALYAGGQFERAAGVVAPCVARWNGSQWSSVGGLLFGACNFGPRSVSALASYGGQLYAGGRFGGTGFPNQPVRGIARWNGTEWSEVGGGFSHGVGCGFADVLATYDAGGGQELFAAGSFSHAGATVATGIARWDGTSWFALGTGVFPGSVRAMAVHDDGSGSALYVGGSFTTVDGAPAARVARWNGTSWMQVGAGLASNVGALASFADGSGPGLYAGTQSLMYRWDGIAWTPAGPPLGVFRDLAVFDDGSGGGPELYAGIVNTTGSVHHVARWTGNDWAPLGEGIDGDVYAFASFDDGGGPALFVGGGFAHAGGIPSGNVARLRACGPVSSFCAGDGADRHVETPCPCANTGGPGRGCAWHNGPTGALLAASGTPNPDTLALLASGMPASAPSTIFLKGDVLIPEGVVFGDGVRCAGGNLIRLGTKTNVSGAAQYPEAGNPSISVRGGTPSGSGAIGYYQTYFRNAAVFCTSATFNVTNAVRVVW